MRDSAGMGIAQSGQPLVRVEDGNGSDRSIAKTKVFGARVDDDRLRVAQSARDLLRPGLAPSADQQGNVRVLQAQGIGGEPTDFTGTAHEQDR
ncbi:hypothetical protein [Sphingomonas sp. 22R3R2A-7]|uniref:hypothetical protein n=1 Tax=Sphingomonas sp. 22R3R2A-7 TaxID=3050230 RepID=UPI002FE341E9